VIEVQLYNDFGTGCSVLSRAFEWEKDGYEKVNHLGFTGASGSRLSSDDMDPCGSHCEQNWNPRILCVLFLNDVLRHSGAPG